MEFAETVDLVAQWVVNSNNIVVFTGAGISTESGIPDFRSPGGLWDRFDPNEFTYQSFLASEENRKIRWQFYQEMYKTFSQARPNPAHLAIAELEKMNKLNAVITQNIDNLHQQAGNSPEKVIEIHGTLEQVKCLNCNSRFNKEQVIARLEKGEEVPRCHDCTGILKPATISFGEAMPQEEMKKAQEQIQQCDLCFSIGSSLVVYPAAQFPLTAKQQGARLVIVNREPTHADPLADAVLHGTAGEIMKKILDTAKL